MVYTIGKVSDLNHILCKINGDLCFKNFDGRGSICEMSQDTVYSISNFDLKFPFMKYTALENYH